MTPLLYRLFIFLLIFSPLAFGTVEQWSLAIMESLAILALLLLFFRNKDQVFYEVPGIVPLVLFLAYILIQLVPLPPGVIKFISPTTYSLYHETVGIVEPVGWMSISINQKATLAEFFRFAAYVGIYVVTIQLLSKKEFLKKTVTIIITFGTVLSIFALLQYVLSNGKIFWLRDVAEYRSIGYSHYGSFIYRNHYAATLEMILPLVLCLFFYYKPQVHYQSFRERISEILNQHKTNTCVLFGFSAILITTSIFVSASRGGIISVSLASILLVFMLLIKRKVKKQSGILFLVIMILVVFSVGWFGWERIFERFENIRNADGIITPRVPFWSDSIPLIRDFPAVGTGFGTFLNVFPAYATQTKNIREHAHNDYIEILADGGVIAFLLSVWFLISLLYKSYKAFRKRRESYSVYLYLGSLAGIIAIVFHCHVDWILYGGASGLYFFFVAALAVSAANTRLRHKTKDTNLKEIRSPLWKIVGVPVGLVLIGSLAFNVGALIGKAYSSPLQANALKEDISREQLLKMSNAAYKAARFDPLEAAYPFEAARSETLLTNASAALANHKKAVRLNPVSGEYLQSFGLFMSGQGDEDTAGKLLQAGIKYDRSNPERYRAFALWLFARGKNKIGAEYVKGAVSLDPGKTNEYIAMMGRYGRSDEEIGQALPEKVVPHLVFGDYVFKKGDDQATEEVYLKALEYIKNEENIRPWHFYKVYGYYMKKGLHEEALKIMQRAITVLPRDAKLRVTTAGLYEKLGITYRAREEYQKALALEPGNREARQRLEER